MLKDMTNQEVMGEKYSEKIVLPENIGYYLVKDEKVVYSTPARLKVDKEGGYNVAVTDKRIIFAKKKKGT